jgi:hypothetical protein
VSRCGRHDAPDEERRSKPWRCRRGFVHGGHISGRVGIVQRGKAGTLRRWRRRAVCAAGIPGRRWTLEDRRDRSMWRRARQRGSGPTSEPRPSRS